MNNNGLPTQHYATGSSNGRGTRSAGESRSILTKFEQPTSIIEARNRLAALFADISLIEAQLTDPNRTDGSERRLGKEEYQRWRKSAKYALASKRAEQMYLKTWVQNTREQKAEEMRSRFQDGREMIAAMVLVVNNLFDRYPDLTLSTADQATVDLARGMVNQSEMSAD